MLTVESDVKINALVSALSLKNPSQALCIEPKRYLDCRHTSGVAEIQNETFVFTCAKLISAKPAKFNSTLQILTLVDYLGVSFDILAPPEHPVSAALQDTPKNQSIFLHGKVKVSTYGISLKQVTLIDKSLRGRITPFISGVRNKLPQEQANNALRHWYRAVLTKEIDLETVVAQFYSLFSLTAKQMQVVLSRYGFDKHQLVKALINRNDAKTYRQALQTLRRLNVTDYLYVQNEKSSALRGAYAGYSIAEQKIIDVLDALENKLKLTQCQKDAITVLASDFAASNTGNGLLNGDVGTGKSIVFAALSVIAFSSGKSVAIMCPNMAIAQQHAEQITTIDPSLPIAFVSGSEKPSTSDTREAIFIGTVAINNWWPQNVTPDLFLIDEEQLFGTQQKYTLVGPNTYQLLASATCIPATIALAEVGRRKVVSLKTRHVDRCVSTYLHETDGINTLLKAVEKTINRNEKLLIVLPVSKRNTGEYLDSLSVEKVFNDWYATYGERVTTFTGDMDAQTKQDRIHAIKNGDYQIIIATTATESGINIPKLTQVITIEPARFGARQLHQLRGRAGRHGEPSRFDMLPITPLSEAAKIRLNLLLTSDDGFYIAEQELEQRGFGALNYSDAEQFTSPEHIIKGRKITPADVRYCCKKASTSKDMR